VHHVSAAQYVYNVSAAQYVYNVSYHVYDVSTNRILYDVSANGNLCAGNRYNGNRPKYNPSEITGVIVAFFNVKANRFLL
jgi:hypothetical protein